MGQSRAFVERRRAQMEELIRSRGELQVADLADQFGISPLTVRRDLDFLESKGLISRRYGVAISSSQSGFHAAKTLVERAREAISRRASELIENGEQVFINTSTTALDVISHIGARDVTIITNSVSQVQALAPSPGITVLVTGGEVRMPRGVLSGEFALNNIRSVRASRCFVGCAGISPAAGATSNTLQEAIVNAQMIQNATYRVLLADSTKLSKEAGFTYAQPHEFDLLITDSWAAPSDLDALREAGLTNIELVNPDKDLLP
ncbi:MAG: DeoR/GlpR family DNA-binding transcription regulator [Atopobiaceae bacterium]|jgi:DeoR family fructose operon transcriptional repressor